jgi:hypothetical protein
MCCLRSFTWQRTHKKTGGSFNSSVYFHSQAKKLADCYNDLLKQSSTWKVQHRQNMRYIKRAGSAASTYAVEKNNILFFYDISPFENTLLIDARPK